MYIKGKCLVLMFLVSFLFICTSKVNVASALPSTYFFVDPAGVRDIAVGGTFLINVNVSDAPSTYAWEVYVSWDTSVLELFYKKEGDFLKRPPTDYQTTFTTYPLTPPWDEANANGEIMVGCSLFGDVPWATGDGWLFSLGFRVKADGKGVINLFSTSLNDHLVAGAPTPTYYPNLDGFFFNEPFHNIAITSVAASPSVAKAGELVAVEVSVANRGNFSETLDVAVYADTQVYNTTVEWWPDEIVIGDEVTVGTQTVSGLAPGSTTTLSFSWNTTVVEEGNYNMSAKSLLSDDDTRDNIFIDGEVTIQPPALLHDIAVASVVPSPTEVRVGENVTINVIVKNEGNFSETFNVSVYADLDTAVIGDELTVGTKEGVALTNGTSTTLVFTWDTTGVSEGKYTMSAKVPPVTGEREAEKADNTHIDGTVIVQGSGISNIVIYAAAGIVIIIVAAVLIYILRFRKRG